LGINQKHPVAGAEPETTVPVLLSFASSQLLTINLSTVDSVCDGRSVREGKEHTEQEPILHFRFE